MKLRMIQAADRHSPAVYLVTNKVDGVVGMLEKYRNTRTEIHPWKAFQGVGGSRQYIGAFYKHEGGQRAAIKAVESLGIGLAKLELRVVAVSENSNSFGLTGVVLMDRDGRAWEVGHCQHPEPWMRGQTLFFSVDLRGNPRFHGCELPRVLSSAPQAVIDEVWGK